MALTPHSDNRSKTPPTSSHYSPVIDDCRCFDNNHPPHSLPKPRKWLLGFEAVNTIATVLTILLTLLNILVYKLRELQQSNSGEKFDGSSLLPSEQLCRRFSLAEILSATNDFDDSLVVGRGGFGKVYKGAMDNGASIVAVKRLDSMSKQGANEFWTEISMLSKCRHGNLVSLIGYCDSYSEMILVYEYMARGTIADHLHKNRKNGNNSVPLCWVERLKICIGAARGLDYLHSGTGTHHRVIHRDVKSSNILLDVNWAAKISDFGMSKIGPTNQRDTHVSTHIKGTIGYLDPEYLLTRRLTRKSDVYAFGVVLFEVLCGRPAVDLRFDADQRGLARWAQYCVKEGIVERIIDPDLKWEIFPDSLSAFVKIADQCLHVLPRKRPTMTEVVAALEGALTFQERRNYSMAEEYIFNYVEAPSGQEIVDSCTKEMVIVNVEDSSTKEKVVVKVEYGEHQDKKVGTVFHFGRTKFVKKFRLLFSVKPRTIPASGGTPLKVAEPNVPVGASPRLTGITIDLSVEFSYEELSKATDDFSHSHKIGQGGFGAVYYAELRGEKAAIKKMDMRASREFLAELKVLTHVHHLNLVRLIGYCVEGSLFIVYEFIENGNLSQHLRGTGRDPLPWATRVQIALDSARGLQYIHEHTVPVYIHRDVKPANILIDKNFHAKVVDFGLTKLTEVGSMSIHTRLVGTFGYMPPEYMQYGDVSPKVDVYAFGVAIYELISAKEAIVKENGSVSESKALVTLFEEVLSKPESKEDLGKLIDPRLGENYPLDSVCKMAHLARACTHENPQLRPGMRSIVVTLMTLSSSTQD